MSALFEGFETRRIATGGAEINLVTGGSGPGLLLLHGYPQTHAMWHKIAPLLAEHFTVVAPDLRGYGDSDKPADDDSHFTYSKRAMGQDMAEVMSALGLERFCLAGHDRGGRVAHRLTLDHADRVEKLAVLDIAPTYKMFQATDQHLARATFHWFFLIQDNALPETMIGHDPDFFVRWAIDHWGMKHDAFDERAMAEYLRCMRDPATIHATCNDYRAGASIDLEHDEADMATKIACPMLVIWGDRGRPGAGMFDMPEVWRERAADVRGGALPCGHFLPEEAPEHTFAALRDFFQEA